MSTHKLRIGVAKAATAGAAALFATLVLGGGVASATPPSDPVGGATRSPLTSTTETSSRSGAPVRTRRSS